VLNTHGVSVAVSVSLGEKESSPTLEGRGDVRPSLDYKVAAHGPEKKNSLHT
jgi:hypothetical protein